MSFGSLREIVERSYPQPLATAFRRYRVADPEDFGSRHEMLVGLFQLFVRFIVVAALQEGLQRIPDFVNRLPQKAKTLEFLRRPSLGSFVGLLRTLETIDCPSISLALLPPVMAWYTKPPVTGTSHLMAAAKALSLPADSRPGRPNAHICDLLVNYRNKSAMGHGAHSDELRDRLPLLEQLLAHLFHEADFLASFNLVLVEQVAKDAGGHWSLSGKELRGIAEEPFKATGTRDLDVGEMYLAGTQSPFDASTAIHLSPFLLWRNNPRTHRGEAFFFNDAWRTKLEYLSFATGDYYYHRELKEEFRDLLNIDIRPTEDEEFAAELTADQRASRAEEHFRFAMHLVTAGKLEDALARLERSAEYERRPATFLEIARLQMELHDPPGDIEATLRRCLELDPDNADANRLLQHCADSTAEPEADATPEALATPKPISTLVDALTPPRFRPFGALFWNVLLTAYYAFSSVMEWHFGQPLFVASLVGMYVCCLVFTAGLASARALFAWLRSPLSLQLDNMRLERFNAWHASQGSRIFGKLRFDGSRWLPGPTLVAEPQYWLLSIAWLAVIQTLIFIGTDSLQNPPPIIFKRLIDYFLLIMWLYPCVRYIVCTTLFIFEYSRLPLKPMLTRINDEGIRSLGSLMTFNITLAAIAYTAYFLPASFTHRAEIRSDVAVLAIITLIVMVWSLGMPAMVRRAARQARSKAVQEYSEHIESAFGSFLANPEEDSLARYEWLRQNQRVIQRIGTWPLSFWQTLYLVIFSNVLLLALTAHYVAMRYDLWESIMVRFLGRG